MTTVAFVIYRLWAYKIFIYLKKKLRYKKIKFILISPKNREFKYKNAIVIDPKNNKKLKQILIKKKVNIVLFYGWSWIVDKNIYENFLSLCLHPSKLPDFKGGSPIQHQIINNLKESAVSVLKISKNLDGGDIYDQKKISLNGKLSKIFYRITLEGYKITSKLINVYEQNNLKFKKQKKNKKKIFKRRKNSESRIDLEKIKSKNLIYLKNFIRMLDDPYPNAYIELNNKKIYIKKVKKNYQTKNIKFVENSTNFKNNLNGFSIKMKNCNALIVKSNL